MLVAGGTPDVEPLRASRDGRIAVVTIKILKWSKEAAWTSLDTYLPKDLPRRLLQHTDLDRRTIKRLVRQLRDQRCVAITLREGSDRLTAHSIRQLLESCGAEVHVDDTPD